MFSSWLDWAYEFCSSNSKESACSAGDLGLVPRSGKSPGEENGNPPQYSCLENPHGQKSLVGHSPWGHRVGHDRQLSTRACWKDPTCQRATEKYCWCSQGYKFTKRLREELGSLLLLLKYCPSSASLVFQMVKNLPTMQKTQVLFLGWVDPLEKRMASYSSILAWRISWTEEPGGQQSRGSQRVRHNWVTNTLSPMK